MYVKSHPYLAAGSNFSHDADELHNHLKRQLLQKELLKQISGLTQIVVDLAMFTSKTTVITEEQHWLLLSLALSFLFQWLPLRWVSIPCLATVVQEMMLVSGSGMRDDNGFGQWCSAFHLSTQLHSQGTSWLPLSCWTCSRNQFIKLGPPHHFDPLMCAQSGFIPLVHGDFISWLSLPFPVTCPLSGLSHFTLSFNIFWVSMEIYCPSAQQPATTPFNTKYQFCLPGIPSANVFIEAIIFIYNISYFMSLSIYKIIVFVALDNNLNLKLSERIVI